MIAEPATLNVGQPQTLHQNVAAPHALPPEPGHRPRAASLVAAFRELGVAVDETRAYARTRDWYRSCRGEWTRFLG